VHHQRRHLLRGHGVRAGQWRRPRLRATTTAVADLTFRQNRSLKDKDMDSRAPAVKGRCVDIAICERDVGFVMSIGVVSVWLSPAVARDLLDTLARAIALSEAADIPHRGCAPRNPRG